MDQQPRRPQQFFGLCPGLDPERKTLGMYLFSIRLDLLQKVLIFVEGEEVIGIQIVSIQQITKLLPAAFSEKGKIEREAIIPLGVYGAHVHKLKINRLCF